MTGTDTGVGKTFVACAVAAWLHRRVRTGVMKPIATGGRLLVEGGRRRWVSDDALRLAWASGSREPWALINPVCFEEPLAPLTAARRVRRPIRIESVMSAFHALSRRHDVLIVEGVGGLLVPLTDRLTVADLARRLRLPLLVVARPGLGTLNHTLLTIQCARRAGLPVLGVVFNHAGPRPRSPMARVAETTNPGVLERVARVPVLGTLPWYRGEDRRRHSPGDLAGWIERHLAPSFFRALAKMCED